VSNGVENWGQTPVENSLAFEERPENPSYQIAVAGEPEWIQEPEQFVCSCGTEMAFVCQISEHYKFQKLPTAPEQPDSSYTDGYVLFLGNEVFVFACPKQCNTRAIWVTVQN